ATNEACEAVPLRANRHGSTPPHVHGKEGVDGSSPSEGFTKGQQMALFCCLNAIRRTLGPTRNLSPRPVPNIRARAGSWLEQTDWRRQSTSVAGRALWLAKLPLCSTLVHLQRLAETRASLRLTCSGSSRQRSRCSTRTHRADRVPR